MSLFLCRKSRSSILQPSRIRHSHTYEIKATEPFHFFAQVLVPDIDSSTNNISGIIIREPEAGGQVHEIAPILSQEAEWKSVYEPFGGDSYREGPVVEKELEAGTYRIEVHTPNNVEKYVLVVGKREEMTLGYFELVRRIAGVKLFFEKSQFRIIESPFIYVPLLGMGILFVIARAIRRYSAKRRKTTNE
jgi:hypothetical protein